MSKSRANLVTLREAVANQRALGRRLNWLLALPLAITAMIAYMFFTMNARLKDVELGAKLVTIERFLSVDRNFEWAAGQYEELAKSSPSAAILARLGMLYYLLDKNESKAIEQLEKAKQLDPTYWEIYRSLTFIYQDKKRCKDAIEAGEMAIKLNARDAASLNNLANIHTDCGARFRDLIRARDYANRAVELTQERNAQFLDTLAKVQHERGEDNLARTFLLQAIVIAPNDEREELKKHFAKFFPNEPVTASMEARQ